MQSLAEQVESVAERVDPLREPSESLVDSVHSTAERVQSLHDRKRALAAHVDSLRAPLESSGAASTTFGAKVGSLLAPHIVPRERLGSIPDSTKSPPRSLERQRAVDVLDRERAASDVDEVNAGRRAAREVGRVGAVRPDVAGVTRYVPAAFVASELHDAPDRDEPCVRLVNDQSFAAYTP